MYLDLQAALRRAWVSGESETECVSRQHPSRPRWYPQIPSGTGPIRVSLQDDTRQLDFRHHLAYNFQDAVNTYFQSSQFEVWPVIAGVLAISALLCLLDRHALDHMRLLRYEISECSSQQLYGALVPDCWVHPTGAGDGPALHMTLLSDAAIVIY
ncbi:hypothetical protein F4802DRAFT_240230 [Xylaria palmicola]|nr:hypothetical protein F4802DRAFT_240230 [Xylaria palmicola]